MKKWFQRRNKAEKKEIGINTELSMLKCNVCHLENKFIIECHNCEIQSIINRDENFKQQISSYYNPL